MITIAIHDAAFFAYHGFYPEEQKIGAKFVVDVEVNFIPFASLAKDEIANTVDYEKVYAIIAEQMNITVKLIETVGQAIADQIKEVYPFVDNIRVSIKKLNPPLNGVVRYTNIVVNI